MKTFRLSVSGRIYSIIVLGVAGLIGLSALDAYNLKNSLKHQRESELSHLVQLAVGIAETEHNAATSGAISDDEAKRRAIARIAKLRYSQDDYFWINDLAPRMIMHPAKPELNGTDLSENKDPSGKRIFIEFTDVVKRNGSGFVEYQWPKPGHDRPQPKLSFVSGFGPWGWVIGTGVYVDDLEEQFWQSAKNAALIVGMVAVVLGVITILIARRMSKALVSMTEALEELGNGNFAISLPGLARRDELGDMARSIESFRSKSAEKAEADAAAEARKRLVTEELKRQALQNMAETVERETNRAVADVASGTDRMAASAGLMSETAGLLGENSSSVAAAAEEALATAETVSAASAQLSQSIGSIAAQIASSKQLTTEAVDAAAKAQVTISRLSDTAQSVSVVTNLISEIASQTNLLALNATIEAARAGTAGRGFSVVASEVKSLADQTARATTEISQKIAEIQKTTLESVESISSIGQVIEKVEAVSVEIVGAIEKQNSFSQEIARAVTETSQAAREVAQQITTVSKEAVETGRRALEIREGSSLVAQKVDSLRQILVRVIRTSTSDVDRREGKRHDVDIPVRVKSPAGIRNTRIMNISNAGALLDDPGREFVPGHRIQIKIDMVETEVSGTVLRNGEHGTIICFDDGNAAQELITQIDAKWKPNHAA